jgi:hypothetical protein
VAKVGETINVCRILMVIPVGKLELGTQGMRCYGNIKIDVEE